MIDRPSHALSFTGLLRQAEGEGLPPPLKSQRLTAHAVNWTHPLRGLRGVGERANALLTVTFKALRRVSLDPWRIGKIVQAALVLLNHEHNWTMSASHNVIFSY
ncbi:hypothetical protein ABZ260_18585 [Streptosporangium sp. NPDC006013]|uniref:hypothetical protein n=1 Tax=Streptosporangium sp. NPDC006013 TaxID=3155596 RepID=UPI0033A0F2EA